MRRVQRFGEIGIGIIDWGMPRWLFDLLDRELYFELDPGGVLEKDRRPHARLDIGVG